MKTYGAQSMITPLKRVLVRRPDAAFGNADPARWHYTAPIILADAQREHDALCVMLRRAGAEVVYHDEALPEHADSIFVFDPALVTDHGAILMQMGKRLRQGEEPAMAKNMRKSLRPWVLAFSSGA